MLAPQFGNLTGNDQLNVAKKRLNQKILDNANKSYEIKKEMEGIEDITQLENKDALNPVVLQNNKETNNLIDSVVFLYDKIVYNMNILDGSFVLLFVKDNANVIHRDPNERVLFVGSKSDFSRYRTAYENFATESQKLSDVLNKLDQNTEYIGTSGKKKIDYILNHVRDYIAGWKTKYLDAHGVARYTKELDKVNKAELARATFEDVPKRLEAIYTVLKKISEKLYNENVNPLLKGNGFNGGNLWYPSLNDIPSKYK